MIWRDPDRGSGFLNLLPARELAESSLESNLMDLSAEAGSSFAKDPLKLRSRTVHFCCDVANAKFGIADPFLDQPADQAGESQRCCHELGVSQSLVDNPTFGDYL